MKVYRNKPLPLKIVVLIITIFFSTLLFSSEIPDSISIKLKDLPPDEQALMLKNIAFSAYSNDMDFAIDLTNKGLEIAKKNKLYENQADLLNIQGIIYGAYSVFDSSFSCYDKAIKLCNQYNLPNIKKKVGMNYGMNYYYSGDYAKALEKYHISLKIFEEQKDSLGMAHAMSNIGITHASRKENKKAIDYLSKAMPLYKKFGTPTNMIFTINAIGTAYDEINLDSSLYYLSTGLELAEKENIETSIANFHINLGNAYLKKEDLHNSLLHFKKALVVSNAINYHSAKVKALDNIGRLLEQEHKNQQAIEAYNEALELSREDELKDDELKILRHLANLYYTVGDYKNAYSHLKLTKEIEDSLFNIEAKKDIEELEIKYNTSKKAEEIQKQKMQLKEQEFKIEKMNWRIISLVGGIIILLLMAYIIIRKQKERHARLLADKREGELKAGIKGEEKERERLSSNLHDGLGQSLSSIKLMVESVKDTGKIEDLDKTINNIDKAVTDLREIAHNLMPSSLRKHGFEKAIEDIIENINRTGKINIEFYDNDKKIKIPEDLSFLLFRILQELLNNTIKHSGAENVSIQILKEPNAVSLLIDDDGIGFDPKASINNGLGIRNIQSRVELFNGSITIDSGKGSGTSINIEIPL